MLSRSERWPVQLFLDLDARGEIIQDATCMEFRTMNYRGKEIIYSIRLRKLLMAEAKGKERWQWIRAIWKKLGKRL